VVGHGVRPLGSWARGALLAAAGLMVAKGMAVQLVGLALFAMILGAGALQKGAAAASEVEGRPAP